MSPQRRPQARGLLTRQSEAILATRYAGQVRAAVIERALRRMAAADERAARKALRATPRQAHETPDTPV